MNKKLLKETLVNKSWTNKSFDSLVKWYYDTKKGTRSINRRIKQI